MNKIRELFAKPIDRKIEEVIKVDQADETTVREELEEYVVTDSIRDHFIHVYDEIAKAISNPHEGIGVWVSGFFGAGKSSFAKIVGYTLGKKRVGNRTADEVFKAHVKDEKVSALLENILNRIQVQPVIFDVSMERGVRTANERMTEIMYKALLRELGYAEDFDLAKLEMDLERDGKLDAFCKQFQKMHGQSWQERRELGFAFNEASAVLHQMDSKTYSSPDSWAKGLGHDDISANILAERAFELAARRKPGCALIFVIDEVGQYVSRSTERMLDLQGIIQAFGKEGKNRANAKKIPAPCWIIVTSQEKLNEVVDSLESKKIELAKLNDRFPVQIDLKQSDISEVAGRRVLEKNDEGRKLLEKLYADNEGRLKTCCALQRTGKATPLTRTDFVNLYPYMPYQIELCIDIVAGLRLKRGAHRHIGGSNRTIIKQAQQMMINPRTALAEKPIGTLVTLDRVYELLYLGNLLPTELTRTLDSLPKALPGNEMAIKVAKAIALLEVVKDVPRTPHNIAVVLHPTVTADSVQKQVEDALKVLEAAQVIRESEDGYKLLSAQEKNWDTTRNGLDPKPAERKRILRELLKEIFEDPKVRIYTHKATSKRFRLSPAVEGELLGDEGDIPLNILVATDEADMAERTKEAREESIAKRNDIFWVCQQSDEIYRLTTELYRSREMIANNRLLAAQSKLSAEEMACFNDEQLRADRTQRQLRSKLSDALKAGAGFFQGVRTDGSSLGQDIAEVFHGLADRAIPSLYPKLEMGVRPLKGDEAEKFLTAANLNGLPSIFYEDDNGLALVAKQAGKFVPNLGAPICKELLDYLKREHAYGNKIAGKNIATHFQGLGYGWDLEVIRLALAVLLRGGAIEVTYQGRKYRNHTDPSCRTPFTNKPAFNVASFAPREALDLKTLAEAVRQYEDITGKEVDVEEGAIAQAFQKLAAEDREQLLSLVARMKALDLPGVDTMTEFLETVEGIIDMPADDCVKTLAGEGKSYKATRQQMAKLIEATTEDKLKVFQHARRVAAAQWPVLESRVADPDTKKKAEELVALVESETFYDQIEAIRLATAAVTKKFTELYGQLHQQRLDVYTKALETVKGMPEWEIFSKDASIPGTARDAVLAPLLSRAKDDLELPEGAAACAKCGATVPQLETDIAAVDAFRAQVVQRLQKLVAPEETIERVKVSDFITGRLETTEDIEKAIGQLKEHLLKLLAKGVKIILE